MRVLKALAPAHRYFAELKRAAQSIPNQGILLDTLALQEAKASSEIENIVTTQDELFCARLFPDGPASAEAKEVARYSEALKAGFAFMRETGGLLINRVRRHIICPRFRPGLRETLLIVWFDIRRRLCGIASDGVR